MTKARLAKMAKEATAIQDRDEPEPDEITVRTLAGYIAELAEHLAEMK